MKALAMAVWSRRIHGSGVKRKWLLSSEHWEVLNVFSLPQVMDLNLGDPGETERVDDLLRMDGDTTIEQEKEGDESGMSLVGEGMCGDGAAALEELRQHYEGIDK